MKKEKAFAGILGFAMVATLGVMGVVIWNASRPAKPSKAAVKSVQSIETPSSPSNLSVGNNSGIGGGLVAQDLGSSSGAEAAPRTEQKAEDFSQYEKYKDSKSALFGEVKAGTGNKVAAGSKVSIYYVGRLTDGSVFDQSRAAAEGEQPKALEFVIGKNQVIPGVEQGLIGMKAGGTRRIIVPPAVGYGAKGNGPVPSNAVMVFDVQLLDVK